MGFFHSTVGAFMVQAIFHSLLAVLTVEALIKIWKINNPVSRVNFRFLIVLLPVVIIPFSQLAYPSRGSLSFRQELALFDLQRWLPVRLWLDVPLWAVLAGIIVASVGLFLAAEAVPMVRRIRAAKKKDSPLKPGQFPPLEKHLKEVSQALSQPVPPVFLAEDDQPLVYISRARGQRLVISPLLIKALDEGELKAVLAHELAHMARRDIWLSWALLFFRLALCFNPVALLVFRRIAQENEKVCDELAVRITHDPLSLAASIVKVFRMNQRLRGQASPGPTWRRIFSLADNLEQHGSRILVEERVEIILGKSPSSPVPYEGIRLTLTGGCLAAVLFFVV